MSQTSPLPDLYTKLVQAGEALAVPDVPVGNVKPPSGALSQDPFEELHEATIMLVDDAATTLMILQTFLEDAGYRDFVTTADSSQALDLLHNETPDIVLLDVKMPGVSGFEILTSMRSKEAFRHTPVIILTSSDDPETKLRALQLGATDFLAKPVDSSELVLRVRNTLAAKAYQDRLAYYDGLTGLPNRKLFLQRLERALSWAKREGQNSAVVLIDLDRFKHINDTLGHSAGDELLKLVSQRLESSLRPPDVLGRPGQQPVRGTLSRIGGDEFSVVLSEIQRAEEAAHFADRVLRTLARPFLIEEQELFVTPSIGIAVFPADGGDVNTMLRHADLAMSHAKSQGRNRYQFFRKEITKKSRDRLSLETELHKALEREQFVLHYQPKVNTASGGVVGAESLLRWQHPERGLVPPLDFIPLAEETGLIRVIGDWVLEQSVRQAMKWHAKGFNDFGIAVNVSGQQLLDRRLNDSVSRILSQTGIPPHCLTLELTEHELVDNATENVEALNQIKALGVNISVDDFGTGYSSLSYLERFPINELKIDRFFVTKIDADGNDAPIVSAIIAMAQSLRFKVVAEGVDSQTQLDFLKQRRCDEYQGFLFSRPVPAQNFEALLKDNRIEVKHRVID